MTTWFTSDHHFGHANIIKLCERPFAHRDAMEATLIQRWNNVVQPDDDVYVLGDFILHKQPKFVRSLLEQLKGKKYLVRGNHDNFAKPGRDLTGVAFEWVKDYHELTLDGRLVCLFHYPIASWRGMYRGSWHLHGHSHGRDTPMRPVTAPGRASLDVGVDGHDFRPWSWDEVAARILQAKST